MSNDALGSLTASQEMLPPLSIGSEEHKRLFCGLMLDTHDPFDPAALRWPDLDPESRERLRLLPFWDVAVTTEVEATRDLFAVAKQSGFFAPALINVFEPVIQEEARHIVFFVNWVAYCRANRGLLGKPAHAWRCASAFTRQAWRRVKTAKTAGSSAKGKDFTHEGHKSFDVNLTPRGFFALCLAENKRRMAGYDSRLLRPLFMPTAIGLLCRILPARKSA